MSEHDADWFKVMVQVEGSSQRKMASEAIVKLVNASKSDYIDRIDYAARKYGLTFDQAFNRLRLGESLGEPLDDFVVVPEMEEKLNGLAKK